MFIVNVKPNPQQRIRDIHYDLVLRKQQTVPQDQ